MIRTKSLDILVILVALCFAGTSEANDRKLLNLLSVKGTCAKLVIGGQAYPCKGYFLQTDYDDGRIGFYFVSEEESEEVVTFSGYGPEQEYVSENSRLQPIDGIIGKAGVTKATGECYFENPFAGPARIECEAKGDGGKIYSAQILTDGTPPDITNVE